MESRLTRERIALEDRTGDLELLLELLEDGRSCEAAVADLASHRDGVSPAAAWSALDALKTIGLVWTDEAERVALAA